MEQFRYFDVQQHGDVIVATITDSQLHGETMAELLQYELFEITDRMSPKAVIVDFSNVTMISSSIVSFLLRFHRKLTGLGTQLKLAAMSDTLKSIFKTLHLDGKFTIYQTTADAMASPTGPITYQDIVGRPTPFNLDDSDSA